MFNGRFRKVVFFVAFLAATVFVRAQTRVQVQRDTVVISNGELKINNSTKNVQGYLYNTGNGVTTFKTPDRFLDTLWSGHDTLFYTKGSFNGYTKFSGNSSTAMAIGNIVSGATKGSVLYAGTNGALQQSNAVFYFDSANMRLGIGIATPAAKIHSFGTTEQLRLGYDGSNYLSFTTASNGQTTITPVGTTPSLVINGTLQMASSGLNGNLLVPSPNNYSSTNAAQWLFGGPPAVYYRTAIGRGTAASTMGAGYNYAGLILPVQTVTEGTSGTHRVMTAMEINGLSATNGAGATKYITGLYITNPLASTNTVTPDSASYSIWTETAPRFDVGNDATGDIYYRGSKGAFARLGIGNSGQVLGISGGAPAWVAASQATDSIWSGVRDTLCFLKSGITRYVLLTAGRPSGHKAYTGTVDSIAVWDGDTLRSASIAQVSGFQGVAIGNVVSNAVKGSVFYAGTNGVLQQNNAAFYFDSTQQRLGLGTASPVAKLHSLATTEQLRLGYDANNYTSFTASSAGSLVIDNVSSVGTPAMQFNDIIYAYGGMRTSTALTNGDFATGGVSMIATADVNWLFGGASSIGYRVGGRGATNPVLPANYSYGSWVIAKNPVTAGTSGTHAIVSNLAVLPPLITTGAATVTNAASVYVEDAPTGGTNNWALLVNNGASKFGGDIKLGNAGNGIYIKEGTNAVMGVATLANGTITVNTTKVTANSRIFLTINGGNLNNVGTTYISSRTAGSSFTISSTNSQDASNVAWLIVEPN